ncbi:MAG: peptidoglycan recognition family protein [Bacteroidota bacterium]
MHNLLSSSNLKFSSAFLLCIILISCQNSADKRSPTDGRKVSSVEQVTFIDVDTVNILTPHKIHLTRLYAQDNYGINDYRITSPKMVVIHYTAIPTLDETLRYFKPDSLNASRKKIIKKSPLNVGVHYVIDKDGSIYNLLPDSIMGRHILGFNHIALGIENVARDSSELTVEQLNSNVKLVKYLSNAYPSMQYLIGHQEYDDHTLPHYTLLKADDPNYQPYPKPDPGADFLEKLRLKLNDDYDLVFEK